MTYTYIVAGNMHEYVCYCRDKQKQGVDTSRFKNVASVDNIRGLSECHGFFIGSYKQRPDIEQIEATIKLINLKPVEFQWNNSNTTGVIAQPLETSMREDPDTGDIQTYLSGEWITVIKKGSTSAENV